MNNMTEQWSFTIEQAQTVVVETVKKEWVIWIIIYCVVLILFLWGWYRLNKATREDKPDE